MSRRRRTMIATPRRLPRRRPGERCGSWTLRGAARRAGSASRARPAGRTAHLAYEPDPLHPARARDLVPQGRRSLLEALAVLSSEPDGSRVGTRVQRLLDDMLDQWRALDARAVWLSMIAVIGLASSARLAPGPPHRAHGGCVPTCRPNGVQRIRFLFSSW